ncbi:hypothetical protein I4U23_027147 [Adineta vaga]|nr:hypothetical protein I4U23_027147 [Adineta vaga]
MIQFIQYILLFFIHSSIQDKLIFDIIDSGREFILYYCRIFDFNPDSKHCCLWDVDTTTTTGSIIFSSSKPRSIVGSLRSSLNIYINIHNQSCDKCLQSRYKICDTMSQTCQCPLKTFWNGSVCSTQLLRNQICSPTCDFTYRCLEIPMFGIGQTVAGFCNSTTGGGLSGLVGPWRTNTTNGNIVDRGNDRVMKLRIGDTQDSVAAGSASDFAGATNQLLDAPGDIAFDLVETYLHSSDYSNHRKDLDIFYFIWFDVNVKENRDTEQKLRSIIEEPLSFHYFDGQTTKNIDGDFVFSQLLIDYLLQLKSNSNDKNELIHFLKNQYNENLTELNYIKEFQNNYSSDNALCCGILEKRFFLQNVECSVTVARNPYDLFYWLQNCSKILSSNNNNDLENVVFQIYTDSKKVTTQIFAEIILFMLGSIFRLENISEKNEQMYLQSLRRLLKDMSKFDLAEKYFLRGLLALTGNYDKSTQYLQKSMKFKTENNLDIDSNLSLSMFIFKD